MRIYYNMWKPEYFEMMDDAESFMFVNEDKLSSVTRHVLKHDVPVIDSNIRQQMLDWCEEHSASSRIREQGFFFYVEFVLQDQAMAFKLRWL